MDDYKTLETIGDGSFGVVTKAIHLKTGDQVAIKKIKKKFSSWDECMSLRELKSLRKLTHQNIVKLRECLKVKDELYFVFEFMEQNVYQLYNQSRDIGKTLPEHQIKTVMYHAFSGLAYMHKHGFFHRDLKPENLLITKGITKIADFGLAREIRSRPPYTDYVATRWYRAPEILLKQPNYNSPVDIFALGCIMAELYLNEPLFKGNSELEQMYKICSVLGTPTTTTWNEGLRLAALIGFNFPQLPAVNLATLIPKASDEAIQLITELLRLDPQKRPSAQQVLQHPYFANFVPDDKPFATVGTGASYGFNAGKRDYSSKLNDYTTTTKANDYTSKVNDINDEEHLDILNELGLESALGKENVDWDPVSKDKKEKDRGDWDAVPEKKDKPEWDRQPSEETNPDHLLAEIEEYINSDIGKKEGMPYNKTGSDKTPGNSYGGYGAGIGSNYRGSLSGATGGTYGAEDYDKGSWGGGQTQMGPSTFDLLQKNAHNLSGNNYNFGGAGAGGQFAGAGADMYKFNNAGSNQWGAKPSNMSNKGAQIMNTFVSSNSSKNLNANVGVAFNSGAGTEGYGKYGF